ncbi:MAG: hypothetical protein JW918_01050 [Anaerolineae bacterium]|nr:hypothetical protein [Anaerolineae bacterium]
MDNAAGNEAEHERRWKIATVQGAGGCRIDIYAYGPTLEEARRRAGSVEARVQISLAESMEDDPSEDEA